MKTTLEILRIERFNLVMELADNADAIKDAESCQEAIKLSLEAVTMRRALNACINQQELVAAEVFELDKIYPN